MSNRFIPDNSQQKVIDISGGYHLVLAPPGCGKTQILTERVRRAHAVEGVDYADMLCLTFTNRAARGMFDRIATYIGGDEVGQVYVGNIHRFCSKTLFEQGYVSSETCIIDDDDIISILATQLGEDEARVAESSHRRRDYFEVAHFAHLMKQMRNAHPSRLRMHPECMNSDDVAAIKKLCAVQRLDMTTQTVVDIYDNHDFYLTAIGMDGYDAASRVILMRLLTKMQQAYLYEKYKQENVLMDFEDLLITMYDTLQREPEHRRYRWIQVDEVQDLNPLQLAIIDLLTDTGSPDFTLLYLGDEQQAIFSFMGAKLSTLDYLRHRCDNNVHFLSTNHRSPQYLLNIFNTYAEQVLHIDKQLLPGVSPETSTVCDRQSVLGDLKILRSNLIETEYYDVANVVGKLLNTYPDDSTAVIVSSNSDADFVSDELSKLAVPHFKVSGDDLFASTTMKMMLSHINLLSNEHNFIAWARLMKALGVFASSAYARNFVRHCLNRAMLPSDFLLYEDTTYTQEFVKVCNSDIVVFDTETTGLDVFNDDIAQIAAIRMSKGKIVEGSEFNVYISTSRPLPSKLGDIDNPLLEEVKHHTLLTPCEALQQFAQYSDGATLVGHNADYDYHILRENFSRYAPQTDFEKAFPCYFDTLKLARLLVPDLRQYKLKHLLAVLNLAGQNSHLADDDVRATCSLVTYCLEKAREKEAEQRAFMSQLRVKERVTTLRKNYRDEFIRARKVMYQHIGGEAETPVLVQELLYIYKYGVENHYCQPLKNLHYATTYISHDVLVDDHDEPLATQISNHVMELNTMKEADICGSKSIDDRVFVTTVHKAKGLEFDNVIVFDAVEDRYPSFFNRENPAGIAEDARKFYVAMTRARRRLYVAQSQTRVDFRGNVHPRELTRFMTPILKYFD